MASKVELNKNGRPVNWQGQCWTYYKKMMEFSFAEKEVLEYAKGDATLAPGANDVDKKRFNNAQMKVEHIIMASLSMELGQQVMIKTNGTEMWKYLEDTYEGKTNAATRTNQEIILFNKLQTAKCKPGWDVRQHVNGMFLIKAQLAALNADVRDPIFINMLMRSLPSNARFDRLRGLVEIGASEVDTPDKLRDQILRMDSYNKCDRELTATSASTAPAQTQQSGNKQKSQQHQNTRCNSAAKQLTPEKTAAVAAKKLDKQQGNCFRCHRPGHLEKDCSKKAPTQVSTPGGKQATYTRRIVKSEQTESAPVVDTGDVDAARQRATTTANAPSQVKPPSEDLSVHVSANSRDSTCTVSEWCFDNAANVHVAADRRYFSKYVPFEKDAECVRGFKKVFATNPIGHGTVQLVLQRGELDLVITLRDVFHVPDSRNLLSHSQIEDQGYSVEYHGRTGANKYELSKGSEKLLEVERDKYGLFTFTVKNAFLSEHAGNMLPSDPVCATPRANISAADGAADLQRWHERLGHLCPQFVKVMVDRDLVSGMMLRQRRFTDCEACHMGKERKPPSKKNMDREITRNNETIFADLLFPDQATVLVIVDGYSRFTTVYPLKSKSASEVNAAMQRYIEWGDRQFPNDKVRMVVTDGGGEFVNSKMDLYYKKKGIEFLPNPPHSSHLNPCERAHQTLTHMMKTMMSAAGLPPSLAIHALKMAVYIRNRTYHQAIKDVPYQLMRGKKPNLHRIKKFGSIAYVYKPIGPLRRKMDDNCRLGFFVGLLEGQAGYEVYFPVEHVVQHVEHAHINEDVVYKDRYSDGYTYTVAKWMSAVESGIDTDQSCDVVGDTEESDCAEMEIVNDLPPARAADPNDTELPDYEDLEEISPEKTPNIDVEEEPCEHDISIEEWSNMPMYAASPKQERKRAVARGADQIVSSQADESEEKAAPSPDLLAANDADELEEKAEDDSATTESKHEQEQEAVEEVGHEEEPEREPEPASPPSVEHPGPATQGESSGEDSSQDNESDADDWTRRPPWNTLDIVDAYTIGQLPEQGSVSTDEPMTLDEAPSEHEIVAVDAGNQMDICMVPETITGCQRSPLEAELEDVQELKRQRDLDGRPRRMTLRSEAERHSPKRLDDYHTYASYCARDQAADASTKKKRWHIKDVQVPKSYSNAVRSPQREEWLEGMRREVDAMFSKGVFVLIDEKEMPSEAHLLNTMWRYRAKTDLEGFIEKWRARLVGRGDSQEFGIDYVISFSPVARMVTFRVIMAVAAKLHLTLYQGDIDTAYLNAKLKIKQYVRGIPGFPCPKGKVYRVDQALYGLHQSGAEWFEEVDKFLKTLGYASTETEPCLYVNYRDGILALIPLYVDDVVLATNSEAYKTTLFAAFDEKYGFKDGGLAHEFLGVQVVQNDKGIWINQEKYCKEVLDRFGFGEANGSATPMETNAKFRPNNGAEDGDTPSLDYRAIIGSLMYLATSTRPDIAFPVGYLSRFVGNPTKKHCGAVKRILRYLVTSSSKGIMYSASDEVADKIVVSGHSDADWANDPETRKSVTGYVLTIAGGAVAWAARRQSVTALSTAEAEYVAACEATMEGRGIVNMLDEVLQVIEVKTRLKLGVDNNAAIALAKAPTYNSRTRHIELRWHFIRDQVKRDLMNIYKVDGKDNPADMFTKALPKDTLARYCQHIGMSDTIPSGSS